MKIIPYVEHDGMWTLPNSYLKSVWDEMVDQKTDKLVFHNGRVKSPEDFIRWLRLPYNHVMFIVDSESKPLLFSWLNGVEDKHGWYNFNVFKRGWGKGRDLIKESLDYWFSIKTKNGDYTFKIILGITPADNRLAIRTIGKLATSQTDVIPDFATNYHTGKRYGIVISYLLNPKEKDNG